MLKKLFLETKNRTSPFLDGFIKHRGEWKTYSRIAEIPVIKIRTSRPLANKRSTPVAASFINLPTAATLAARRACIFRPTGCIPRVRADSSRTGEPRVVSRCGRGISLSANGAPPPLETPRPGEKKKKRGKRRRQPQGSSRRLFTGAWVEIKILMVRFRSADGTIG